MCLNWNNKNPKPTEIFTVMGAISGSITCAWTKTTQIQSNLIEWPFGQVTVHFPCSTISPYPLKSDWMIFWVTVHLPCSTVFPYPIKSDSIKQWRSRNKSWWPIAATEHNNTHTWKCICTPSGQCIPFSLPNIWQNLYPFPISWCIPLSLPKHFTELVCIFQLACGQAHQIYINVPKLKQQKPKTNWNLHSHGGNLWEHNMCLN